MARWMQKLRQYDFEIEHRKVKIQGNADALSRRPCDRDPGQYIVTSEIMRKQKA